MEANAALVRTDGVVELHAMATVDADIAVVVLPGHAEGDNAIRLGHPLQNHVLRVFRLISDIWQNGRCDLLHRLVKFGFARTAFFYTVHKIVQIVSCKSHWCLPQRWFQVLLTCITAFICMDNRPPRVKYSFCLSLSRVNVTPLTPARFVAPFVCRRMNKRG